MLGEDRGASNLTTFNQQTGLNSSSILAYMSASNSKRYFERRLLFQSCNCILEFLPVFRAFGIMFLETKKISLKNSMEVARPYVWLIVDHGNFEISN